jgi:hypothetical protein
MEKEDAHALKIAQLDHELLERGELLKQVEILNQEKKQVQLRLNSVDDLIQKLQNHVEAIKSV